MTTPTPIVAGLWSSLAHGSTLRLLVAARPGWVVLDAQHGTWTDASVSAELPGLDTDVPVWVRVVENSAALVGRALDAGAAGVVVPLVDTPQEAAEAVAACHYPPRGRRSFGPMRPLVGRSAPTPADAGEHVRCAVMVETAAALGAVGEIAAVPGVDVVFVGPFDLGLALGRSVDDLLSDDAPDAPLPRVVRACRDAGVRAGAFGGSPERAARLAALGFTDVVVATDAGLLGASARAAVVTSSTTPDDAGAAGPRASSSDGY